MLQINNLQRLKVVVTAATATILLAWPNTSQAHGDSIAPGAGFSIAGSDQAPIRADGHAPIGVMGDHMHKAGEWMLSYRYMRMGMEGNRIGTDEVSPEYIVNTVPNRFFGMPMQPPTLRVVPTEMTMDMHMFGAMYAPTNWLTLMAMANYISKDMTHITFEAMPGADGEIDRIGGFTTRSEGFGDTTLTALVRLLDKPRVDGHDHVHINLGLSLPTGSITERDDVFTPMGMTTTLRLPYAMQLGSGTFDLLPGITYTGRKGDFSWGAQYRATIRLEDENDEGYRLGNIHEATAWIAYQWEPWISTSLRIAGSTQGDIKGIDPEIMAPVQTADPANYGGDRVSLLAGINLVGQEGDLRGHRLAFEIGAPIYEDLNGPQMETDWTFTVGWQKAW